MGVAEGSIMAAIMIAHMMKTSTRSVALQCIMAGMNSWAAGTSMFAIPQAI